MAQRRRISLQDNGIRSSRSFPVPLLISDAFVVCGDRQERRGGEHGQRDVPVPGVVTADLVVVRATRGRTCRVNAQGGGPIVSDA
jgi:hypothetical protein